MGPHLGHAGSGACAPSTAMKRMHVGILTSFPPQTPRRKVLRRWVRPQAHKGALRAEARPAGVFDTVCRGATTCHQRDGRARASLGPSTQNKRGPARSHRARRACKQPCCGSSEKRAGMPSAEHLPDSRNCNLAQLCRKGAGSRKLYWAWGEGLGLRAVHVCMH